MDNETMLQYLTELAEKVQSAIITLSPIVTSGSWLSWPKETKVALRKALLAMDNSDKYLRSPFDKTRKENVEAAEVSWIRKPIESDKKPGKVAKSIDEKLAEDMAR